MKKFTLLLFLLTFSLGFSQTPTDNATDPPTRDAADVISIFSGAYTDVAGSDFNPNWGQAGFGTANSAFDPGTGNLVLGYTNFNYQGTQYGSVQDISSMEFLHVDIWVNNAFNPNVFVISSGGEIAHPITNSGAGSWISVDIPVAGITGNLSSAIQFKFDGGNGSTDAIYVDNLYFWKNPTAAGSDATLSALEIDIIPLAGFSAETTSYVVELVQGTIVVPQITTATSTDPAATSVTINQAPAIPGDATVVVISQNGLVNETYTISFITVGPTLAAPTPPNRQTADVISLFSNAYTDTTIETWNASFDDSTSEDVVAFGDDLKKIAFGNFIGVEFTNNRIDASTMTHFHMDFWTDNADLTGKVFNSKFTQWGGGPSQVSAMDLNINGGTSPPIVTGVWVSIDVEIATSFSNNLTRDDLAEFIITSNLGVVYVDNIYFWKNPTPPANDNACNAETITVDAAPIIGTNTLSTFEASEPIGSCYLDPNVGNSVWYAFVAPASGAVSVSTDFDTPNGDTQIALYTITNCLDLSTAIELACNEDSESNVGDGYNSIMYATGLTPGTTYYIQVDGYDDVVGEFQIQVTALPAVPANDNACDAETLTIDAAPTSGNNASSSFETSEPNGVCYEDIAVGNSVWYTIVAPASGSVNVTTDFDTPNNDTQIALYTITNCLDLSTANELACNEDGGSFGAGYNSIMDATGLTPGNTYYIQVDGYGNTIGEFQIQVTATAPGNDDCADATAIILGTEFSGDTMLATDSGIADASCSMSGGNQDVWYVFTAPVSTTVSLATTADFVAIYDACAGNEVACLANGEQSPALIAGNTYYARIYNSGFAKVAGPFIATFTEASLSTQDFNNELGFSYYPNPVKNTLTLNAQQAITNVAVFNMLGQEVIRTAPNAVSKNVDMSHLQSGAYFVQVTVGAAVETVRVIKN